MWIKHGDDDEDDGGDGGDDDVDNVDDRVEHVLYVGRWGSNMEYLLSHTCQEHCPRPMDVPLLHNINFNFIKVLFGLSGIHSVIGVKVQ